MKDDIDSVSKNLVVVVTVHFSLNIVILRKQYNQRLEKCCDNHSEIKIKVILKKYLRKFIDSNYALAPHN